MAKSGNFSDRFGLYRNTRQGWIAGVLAGFGDHLGIKAVWLRIAFIALAAITHGIVIVFYIIGVFVMKPRSGINAAPAATWSEGIQPDRIFADRYTATPPPNVTDLKTRFQALDARLSRIETIVTTNEFSLRRQFKDLGA